MSSNGGGTSRNFPISSHIRKPSTCALLFIEHDMLSNTSFLISQLQICLYRSSQPQETIKMKREPKE